MKNNKIAYSLLAGSLTLIALGSYHVSEKVEEAREKIKEANEYLDFTRQYITNHSRLDNLRKPPRSR